MTSQARNRFGTFRADPIVGGLLLARFQREDDPEGLKHGYQVVPAGCNRISLCCSVLGGGTTAVVDVNTDSSAPAFRQALTLNGSYQVDAPWYRFELALVAAGALASCVCAWGVYQGVE